jgi:hypothetical protein
VHAFTWDWLTGLLAKWSVNALMDAARLCCCWRSVVAQLMAVCCTCVDVVCVPSHDAGSLKSVKVAVAVCMQCDPLCAVITEDIWSALSCMLEAHTAPSHRHHVLLTAVDMPAALSGLKGHVTCYSSTIWQ